MPNLVELFQLHKAEKSFGNVIIKTQIDNWNNIMEVLDRYVSQSVILRTSRKLFTYFSPVTLICLLVVCSWIYNYRKKHARMAKLVNKIPGPTSLPFIGKMRLKIEIRDYVEDLSNVYSKNLVRLGNAIEMNVDHDGEFK